MLKEIWYTQFGTFTTKHKFEVTGIKIPQYNHSREVAAIFHAFKKPDSTRYKMIPNFFKNNIGT